ncbi:MAG: hypothetical protein R3349_07665 [Geminicoccaceae bacterium]|nr:hypothetical protein [Geminicoccaceae bacterium]
MAAPLEPMDLETNTAGRVSQIVMVIAALMIVAVTWMCGAVGPSDVNGSFDAHAAPVAAADGGSRPDA